jgi:hypothetical protein
MSLGELPAPRDGPEDGQPSPLLVCEELGRTGAYVSDAFRHVSILSKLFVFLLTHSNRRGVPYMSCCLVGCVGL